MSIPWDPVINDRLTRLHFLARQLVWGMNSGNHRSNRVTQSIEFVEHRNYQPGDPISAIDWKVFARTDRLMIRRQQADTDAQVVLVLDATGDMQSGMDGEADQWEDSKFGKALTSLAALTMMSHKRGDPVGAWVCGGSANHAGLNGFVPPSGRSMHPIFHLLASVKPSGGTALANSLTQLNMQLRRKSIVIIVSDWMEDPTAWGGALELMAASGHDIRCLQLYSRQEWEMDLPESIKVFGFEQQSEQPIQPSAMKDIFAEEVARYISEVETWSARANAIWVQSALEDDLLGSLIQLVRGRMR